MTKARLSGRGPGLQFLFFLMAPEAAVSIFLAHLFFVETTEFERPKIQVPNTVVDPPGRHIRRRR